MTRGEGSSLLVCVSGVLCLYKAVTIPAAWQARSDLVNLSVESMDFCGIAPSEIGVLDEGLVQAVECTKPIVIY